MRLDEALRSTSMAGGANQESNSDMKGILRHHHDGRGPEQQQGKSRPSALIRRFENLRDRIWRPAVSPRQEFRRMPLGEEADALAHQLGEQPALVGWREWHC